MKLVAALAITLTAASAVSAQDSKRITHTVDSIMEAAVRGGRAAGLAVAVVRGSDTIAMKGYGFADVEWRVTMPADAMFEIGSVTKQFTAAAILKLVDEGRLSLDDELTKYLPNYPTQGHRVTIRRLLDHTSGIRSYTEIPQFESLVVQRLPRDTLVRIVGAIPFDFAPGTALVYNNSAYFLLGLVIEKITDGTYANYVSRNLFDAAGMRHSRYCTQTGVVEKRAHGYSVSNAGLTRAEYLDHTWPYAAGSLCSTVGDLVAWNRALHTGKLLSEASYRELVSPGTLNDGTRVRYAKGLMVDSIAGRRTIHHAGGINGFLSELVYFPEDTLTIAVLANTTGPVSPSALAVQIAEAISGKPTVRAVALAGNPADYAGDYKGVGRGTDLIVRITATPEGTLRIARNNGPALPLMHLGNGVFDSNRSRFVFVREGGRVTQIRADMITVYSVLQRQTN